MLEHGKTHLHAITVPPLYEMLDDANKKIAMEFLAHPDFKWTSKEILAAPEPMKPLKLTIGNNLSKMFKFVKAMQEAVELGVAEPTDLVPDWSRQRLRNTRLQSIRSKRQTATASATDIGASVNSDLESYSLRAIPGESPESHFKRLCRHRARGGPLQVPRGLQIEVTPLQMQILRPSDSDLRIGNLLKEANTHYGARMGLRRMNILGEVDGLCRQANTEKRLEKIQQALQLSATAEELGRRKQGVAEFRKRSKRAAKAAKEERKRIAQEKRDAKKKQVDDLTALLGEAPVNGKHHRAVELRAFIKAKLEGKYPKVPKSKTMAVIVPYLLAVSTQVKDTVDLKAAALIVRHEMEGS